MATGNRQPGCRFYIGGKIKIYLLFKLFASPTYS
uniref:Uncharacterized protein n=1 Tax=Siphoviridae sp. ctn8e14 TaxID=2827936 RepID=A0A8S5T5B4_9CAUD|nr:MAG TPA: hypothetical protein [Siphoviridae sp. ctn8e14]